MTLLFLALLSAVGIGKGISRVRALKLLGSSFQPFSFGMCDDVARKKLFAVGILGTVEIFSRHTFRIGGIDDCDKRQFTKRADSVRLQQSGHVLHSASARARRQGPAVLSTAEESAKT